MAETADRSVVPRQVLFADPNLDDPRLVDAGTPTYLNTRSSTSRRRASWITTSLPPSISGQNAEACGCRAGSGSKVNSKSWLVR
jgi:hypothetical protein